MEEAKTQAEKLAQNLARRLRSEVQTSARQTMEMLAKSFGAASVRVEFRMPSRASPMSFRNSNRPRPDGRVFKS
jgi:broad specificity phosphatase PhoE